MARRRRRLSQVTARVLVESEAVDRLADLGLSVEILERVMRRADAEASTCTPLDPPIMEGLTRWGRITRYLREELVPAGWHFDNPRNLARTIHPSGEFAIVATSGDELTGTVDLTPTTKYPKGYATAMAVGTNEQLTLDFSEFPFSISDGRVVDAGSKLTWLMLFHVSEDGFHVELSLPDAIVDGRITGWAERIVLPVFPRDGDRLADLGMSGSETDRPEDIVVKVSRR
jgi:hypothetical protein